MTMGRMHLHSSSYHCTLVRSVCSVYLVLGKDPVNDYGDDAPPLILLSLHPSEVCMHLVLGKDTVNDYGENAPPLILLSLHPSEVCV